MRYAIGIEYDGSNYFGWQKQANLPTIQGMVEEALSKVAAHKIEIVCAGRTDAGVHAIGQVAHFDSETNRTLKAWVLGSNTYLPADIRLHWAKPVAADFSARFSATARIYRYTIYNYKTASALLRNQSFWFGRKLDELLMQQAANYLLGEHDFSSFRGSGCQSKSCKRNIEFIKVTRKGEIIYIDIKANAYLLHMVRNIVGLLLEIGFGKLLPICAKDVLEARDRKKCPATAPAHGLCLVKVEYPAQFLQ